LLLDVFCLTRYTSSRAVETVTSPPTAAASTASTTAIKKGPGSSVSVASEVVGICIFIGLIVIHPQGPIIVFNRKVIGFLKKAKPFELNFFIKKKKLSSRLSNHKGKISLTTS